MNPFNGKNLFHIIRRSLNYVDERLIGHGEQVAYIVLKLLEEDGGYSKKERCDIAFIALLHDIGAYKTEEIDNIVQFETRDVWAHSIYGYLFVKHFSPFSSYAPVLLFHHTDYRNLLQIRCSEACRKLAQILNAADRTTVCMQQEGAAGVLEKMKEYQGTKFSQEVLELLEKADSVHGIMAAAEQDAHVKEMERLLEGDWMKDEEIDRFLRMLVFSIDFRSRYTVAHTFATAMISRRLAELLKLDGQALEKVSYGALLHDLGKVGIPLNILEAPGKLSDEEMTCMRTHILLSEKILAGQVDEETARIALRHHEKMDGSGYPNGLKGESLSVSERIIAVADIVSALNGERSYKKAFPPEKVIGILREMVSGHKLCPRITGCMIGHFEEIIAEVNAGSERLYTMYHSMEDEYMRIKAQVHSENEN